MAKLSRPDRWHSAINRVEDATEDLGALKNKWELLEEEWKEVQEEWAAKFQELRDQWKAPQGRLGDALLDLICLQSEYSMWSVPDNLEESRLQWKLSDVTSLNFQSVLDDVGDHDPETFDTDWVWGIVEKAKKIDLPKGYGRD